MALLLSVRVPIERFPDLEGLLPALSDRLEAPVRVDDRTVLAAERRAPRSSWCPWPATQVGFFVPGASTRGVEVGLSRSGPAVEAKICQAALGTWSDWRCAVELAALLAEDGDELVRPGDEPVLSPAEARAKWVRDDARWRSECVAGLEALRQAAERGRITRVSGPAGVATIGPRSWARMLAEGEPVSARRALAFCLDAIDLRGYEAFYPANPLCLDGRTGREVIACLLAPDVATVLRDPEYVLVHDELEGDEPPAMHLLRFEDFDAAFPAERTWIDDRTVAVPAVSRGRWPSLLESMRPWLSPASSLLDDDESGAASEAFRRYLPGRRLPAGLPRGEEVPAEPRPVRPWWKFW